VSPIFTPLQVAVDTQLKPPTASSTLQGFGDSIATLNGDRIAVGRIGLECRGFPTSNGGKYFWGARSNGQAAIEALILGEFQNGFEY
jgi:hypothetical protein